MPIFLATGIAAQPRVVPEQKGLEYFFPEGDFKFSPEIPTPEQYMGFQVGQQHADYSQITGYMKVLAEKSPRVAIKEMGRTYQNRPFLEVIISSEENMKKIDELKQRHLSLSEKNGVSDPELKSIPAVVNLVYSIHGNEPSGVNASLPLAYLLAAGESPEIDKILDNTIVVITPGANPDGINRFASWVNSSRSFPDVIDLNSREFLEPWPSSRTNHYWADCNRDWLMLQHPEGINGVETYFDWLPNIVVDQHEQGSARPFYFSPGHPKRTHPLTPQLNQDLTAKVSSHVAGELDKIGTVYYSKEGYDDYYYGKGAAYGDIHGSVCLLYEQGTSRGHHRMTVNGPRTFAWTIRNQALASYASLVAAAEMKEQLNRYQKEYYENSAADAAKQSVKGYVFDTRGSKAIEYHFLDNMRHHRIDVYRLAKDLSAGKNKFKKDNSFIIPVEQKNSSMVRAVMENMTEFDDSTFYDISAWTFPAAFNLRHEPVGSTTGLIGDRVEEVVFRPGKVIGGKSDNAYLFETTEFYAPMLINELQKKGLYLSASNRPFLLTSGDTEKQMGYGTILVTAQNQPLSSDEIYSLISELAKETGVDIYAAHTALMSETDLGSPAFKPIKKPEVAILTGRSMGIPDSGEIWFLLSRRMGMEPVLIESNTLTAKKLSPYNVIILANGVPDLTKKSEEALKQWVAEGGTLIATGKAYKWVSDNGMIALNTKNAAKADSTSYRNFADKSADAAGQSIPGVILNCKLDKSHPLGWGLDQDEIAVIKKGNIIFKKNADPYISPLHYTTKPVISGFLSQKNRKLVSDTPAAFAKPYKSGNIIVFADDLNFRSYWFGGSKIFMNAIFYKDCI